MTIFSNVEQLFRASILGVMANDTCLQMVSSDEIEIVRKLAYIGPLDKPRTRTYSTYFAWTINFLIVGNPIPNPKRSSPLGAALFGWDLIDCDSLEAGRFGTVPPHRVRAIAVRLEKLDLRKVATAFADADKARLTKHEDFHLLSHEENAGKLLVRDIRRLTRFYRRAVGKRLGIIMYTA